MHYLITGGSGFIGQRLTASLLADGHQVSILTRTPEKYRNRNAACRWVGWSDLADAALPVDGVINLAGAAIADKRWSEARKAVLRSSRIELTERLIDTLARNGSRPAVLISGSAVGYYGSELNDLPLNEQAEPQQGFTHALCRDWENAAKTAADALGARVCLIRTGIVLGQGGALAKMLPAFRLGLGGPMGHGRQWMSWIHIDDEVAAIRFLLAQQTLTGPFNLTAPGAVNNATFTQTLGAVLKRPTFMRVPAPVLRLLLGEASELLLEGQRVYPEKLLNAGFEFRYSDLEPALRAVTS